MEAENNKYIDLIDKHLAGTLSEEEVLLFEEKLKQKDFKDLLTEMQQIKAGIRTFELRRVKNLLEEEEQEMRPSPVIDLAQKKSKFTLLRFLKIAAMFIGVSLGAWGMNEYINNGKQDYFDQYFTPQTNPLAMIEKGVPNSDPLIEAYSYYHNGEYKEFLEVINPLISENNNDDNRFYQANALLATNQLDEAILVLNQIIENGESKFVEHSKWFLGLSYLRKKQVEDARLILEEITDPYFKPKAGVILEDLDKR